MKFWTFVVASTVLSSSLQAQTASQCPELLDFSMRKLDSREEVRLCDAYRDKVLLVVNTASRCAFTPQYEALEKLYADKKDDGLVILGFPSNDFGNQEPGGEDSIKNFCRLTYGVNFPMFAKVNIKGEQAHPFYKALIAAADSRPKWNFHKYLIGRDGKLIDSYWSMTKPDSPRLLKAIDKALQ